MKLIRLSAAIFAVSLPFSSFAMGMGDIEVHSFLNQEFNAEIPIIDINNVSLEAIKVNLASVEDYERIGLEPSKILSFLKFSIKKDKYGHPVISITSTDRISDPYLQIVVDLAWPAGQIYRAYTVLLDPPGYKVKTKKSGSLIKKINVNKIDIGKPGVINKPVYQHIKGDFTPAEEQATYGPTVAGENIWQIANRYKTDQTTLPQVILAIVSKNLNAFIQGNLNGLKVGEKLKIPSNEQIVKIPAELAQAEVANHDVAWQTKQEIKHVISPPYLKEEEKEVVKKPKLNEIETTYYESKIARIPKFSLESSLLNNSAAVLPAPEVFSAPTHTLSALTINGSPHPNAKNNAINTSASIGVTLAAIDAIRTENSLMKAQMDKLKIANNQLQQQVNKQQKELVLLREQIKTIIKERQGLNAQALALNQPEKSSHSWLYWLLGGSTIIVAYGCLYWFWLRQREDNNEDIDQDTVPTSRDLSPLNHSPPPVSNPFTINKTSTSAKVKEKSEEKNDVVPVVVPTPSINETRHKENLASDHTNLTSKQQNFTDSQENDTSVEKNENTNNDNNQSSDEGAIQVQQSASEKSLNVAEVNNAMQTSSQESSIENNDSLNTKESTSAENNLFVSNSKEPLKQDEVADGENNSLEFEAGLDKFIKPTVKQEIHDDQALDFVVDDQVQALLDNIKQDDSTSLDSAIPPTPVIPDQDTKQVKIEDKDNLAFNENKLNTESKNMTESQASNNTESEAKLIKSHIALDTLLSLARTYITMEDFESAEQSLEEVIAFGNTEQKKEAQKLLDSLKK
ncbi:FimV/HubP family polar landmark protein [Legionella sp. D16C41]|uniref:FimV/HubP family polar landmark protein n=1 Tax=Legionella sp. D16C41 TaxID=3402688 RepID=UPI003AF4112D